MAHWLDGKITFDFLLRHAFLKAQTDIESEEIIKHHVALGWFCGDNRGTIDINYFLVRKFHYIMARDENYRDQAAKFAAEPFTEDEKLYMASPEYSMTMEEFKAAHPKPWR